MNKTRTLAHCYVTLKHEPEILKESSKFIYLYTRNISLGTIELWVNL